MRFLRELIKCRVRQVWNEVERKQQNLIHKERINTISRNRTLIITTGISAFLSWSIITYVFFNSLTLYMDNLWSSSCRLIRNKKFQKKGRRLIFQKKVIYWNLVNLKTPLPQKWMDYSNRLYYRLPMIIKRFVFITVSFIQ